MIIFILYVYMYIPAGYPRSIKKEKGGERERYIYRGGKGGGIHPSSPQLA
jgi:hypothetical protein